MFKVNKTKRGRWLVYLFENCSIPFPLLHIQKIPSKASFKLEYEHLCCNHRSVLGIFGFPSLG